MRSLPPGLRARRAGPWAAAVLPVLLAAGPARAEAPAPPTSAAAPRPPRSLDGRRFLLSSRVPHPFVVRAVTFRQGAALVRIPDVAGLSPDAPVQDLLLVAAVERIGLAVPVSRRVGLVGGASGEVSAGADGASALLGGARAGFDWDAGATVVAYEAPRVQVSVNPGFFGARGVQVVPMSVVANAFAVADDAADDAEGAASTDVPVLTRGLVRPTRTAGGSLAVAAAWRASDRVGLLGGVRMRTGWARAGDAVGVPVSVSAGAAADWRFVERSPVVGKLEYRYRNLRDAAADSETPLEAHLESRHHVGAGLFWRGRHESELGLSAWTLLRDAAVDEQLLGAEAVLRVFL